MTKDTTLYKAADQTFYSLAGMNYAGSATGTTGEDTINLQTTLTDLLAANTTITNTNRGLIFSDQGGNDTTAGTDYNDFFWLSAGDDSINGGAGTQDRVALYWAPSTTAGAASISIDRTTTGVVKVNQTQNSVVTELVRFTLNSTNVNDKYWTAENKSTTFAYSFSGTNVSFGTDTLRGIEQAVLILPSTLLDTSGNPMVTLTGTPSLANNAFVVDLPTS